MKFAVPLLLLVSSLSFAATPIRLPEASPEARVTQDIGISNVEIVYHRPGAKGREIWGALVPMGAVWRLGANEATTIELSHEGTVAGHLIPAGKYALFAIPGETEWTLILNRQAKQWGAYFYKESEDLVRFQVPASRGEHVEWMEFSIDPAGEGAVEVEIAWADVRVPFRVEFPVKAMVWREIDRALAAAGEGGDNWESWHQAARWALETGERIDEALTWIDRAMAEENYWNYELKARLLQVQGDLEEALPLMEKAIETASGKAPQEYVDGLRRTVVSWKADQTGS